MDHIFNFKKCIQKLFLFYKIFLLYKMSSTTYYQRNRDVMLNRAKEYYKNNKKRLREQARDNYGNMSEKKKQKIKEYQKNYREAKKIIIYTGKINNELICEYNCYYYY